MKYMSVFSIVMFFFIPIVYAFPDSVSMLDVIQEKLVNIQKTVAQAPDFSEKGETFTALNNIRKEFLQPAEGMRDATRFLEKTQELNAFNQGMVIQKILQEKKDAYTKEKRRSKGLEANLDKTPHNDPSLLSKKKK